MKYYLARQHLRSPALWSYGLLTALVIAFDPEKVGLGFLALMVVALPGPLHPPRLSAFEAALPVHARVLLEARMLAALCVVWLSALVWAVSFHLQYAGIWPLAWMFCVPCVLSMCIMTIYLCDGSPRLFAQESLRMEIAVRLLIVAGAAAAIVLVIPRSIALGVLIVFGAAMYRWHITNIAESISLAVSSAQGPVTSDTRPPLSAVHTQWWWPLARASLWWPAVVVFGMGVVGGLMFSVEVGLSLYVGVFYLIFRTRLQWMSALPFSPGLRLLMLIGPYVIAGIVGSVVGLIASRHVYPYQYSLTARGQDTNTPGEWYGSPSRVSLTYWQTVPQHTQPTITAPWGESVQADTITVIGSTFFNPYTSRESNSAQFIEWQFGRATETVLGRTFTQDEYNTISLRDKPRSVMKQTPAIVCRLLLTVALMLLFAWTFEVPNWYRVPQWPKLARYAIATTPFAPMFLFLILPSFLLDLDIVSNTFVADRLQLILLQISGQRWTPWLLLAGAGVLLMWRVLLWQFSQSERAASSASTVARPDRAPAPHTLLVEA